MRSITNIKGRNESFNSNLHRLFEARDLLITWSSREIRARYRQSVLGFGWALLQPVFQIVVISVIFGSFLRIPSGDLPYPIFSYAAILPWTLFSGSISSAVPSIVSNMHLMTKIYFPREIVFLFRLMGNIPNYSRTSYCTLDQSCLPIFLIRF